MKKNIIKNSALLIAGVLLSSVSMAQNAPAFDKGDNTIGISIGVGGNFNYYNGYRSVPSFSLYYDHGSFGEIGPGTIGIGGIVGFKTASYDYPDNYWVSGSHFEKRWTDYIVAARATYHLTLLKDKNNKFDPYAGIVLGVRFQTYKDTYYQYRYDHNQYYGYSNDDYYYNGHPYAVKGVFIGAKYNFTKFFGAFAELGYDISIIRVGLNFNF